MNKKNITVENTKRKKEVLYGSRSLTIGFFSLFLCGRSMTQEIDK
jgi:hypothetical protein